MLAVARSSPVSILDEPLKKYTPIDLSITNCELADLDLSDPGLCQQYIDLVLNNNSASVAFGGYLEKRALYRTYQNFLKKKEDDPRNIHLGIDFWSKAGTRVMGPIDGTVHSFRNNNIPGDYGPTIILDHQMGGITFYTLYGHLSLKSLEDLYIGRKFKKGEYIGDLGTPDINVNYASHLHFQIIKDVEAYRGDYPGVSNVADLEFYTANCPDPNILLNLPLSFVG